MSSFPIDWVRSRFPAVTTAEKQTPPFAFMDNAGGAQVPENAIERMNSFFIERNVNLGGSYSQSRENTEFTKEMRARLSSFFGAASPDEVIYGLNATTLIRLLATALREGFNAGDEIIISTLEHEANVTPWLRLQLDGIKIRFWEPRGPEALLELGDLKALLTDRTRLVAVCGASNLLGTVNDISAIAEIVHERGSILFVDGVHSAPHRRTDVGRDAADVFICSGYKVFGAHIGFAAVSKRLLTEIPSLNHYFLRDKLKLELGTQNFEGLAAMAGVLDYFSELADRLGIDGEERYDKLFEHIGSYELELSRRLIGGLLKIDGVKVYGITDPARLPSRTPTAAFTIEGHEPRAVAARLGEAGLGVNDGDLYAARIVDWLGLRNSSGVVRASLCHYNTFEEIDRLLEAVASL